MYPFVRMLKELWINRNAAPIGVGGTHVSHHICWPWDIDLWMELNNGRTLTLYDLGRIPFASRVGLIKVLRQNKWALTVAGVSVRYRRRIRPFERIEMRSRVACWDERFVYLEQSMWKSNGECANHALYRTAATDRKSIIQPARVMSALGIDEHSPAMPHWIAKWTQAEAERPWPPMAD